MKTYNKRLGTWLMEKRKLSGKTQQDVADQLTIMLKPDVPVTKTAISYWETAKRSIDAKPTEWKVFPSNTHRTVSMKLSKKN